MSCIGYSCLVLRFFNLFDFLVTFAVLLLIDLLLVFELVLFLLLLYFNVSILFRCNLGVLLVFSHMLLFSRFWLHFNVGHHCFCSFVLFILHFKIFWVYLGLLCSPALCFLLLAR